MISYLLFTLMMAIPLWKIHEKAGQNPAIAISCFIPLVGPLISMGVLAFGKWKVANNAVVEG